MAGPSIGTWVKVRNKSGRMTARVIANKFGGGSYEQGQVITQSEYNAYKEKRAEGKAPNERQSETKKARAKEDELKLEKRGTEMQRRKDASRKSQQSVQDKIKNNQSINRLGAKGKTEKREFNVALGTTAPTPQFGSVFVETGMKSVKGRVRGAFGIHDEGGLTVLTHLPTGMAVARLQKKMVRTRGGGELNTVAQVRKAALALADKLNDVSNVDQARIARDATTLKAMRDVITSSLDGRY